MNFTVLHRTESDGTDIFTVSWADSDFRFEGWYDGSTYRLSFEEGFGYRGEYLDSCPDDCWKALLGSPELDRAVDESVDRISRVD